MADHNSLGKEGERLAADYLQSKSHAILERNWRFGRNEIDLITLHDKFIVIVEVKTREGWQLVEAERSITRDKQQRLVRAAHAYIRQKGYKEEVRFDVVVVTCTGLKHEIRHIESAFYPIL